MKVIYVPPDKAMLIWDDVKEEIQRAIDHSGHEEELQDFKKKIEEEIYAVLLVVDKKVKAVITVQFMDYPQFRALRVVTIGGTEYSKWKYTLDEFLTDWAKEQGMSRIEFMGREGHVRALKPLGYQKQYTFMTKDIENG